MKLEILTPDKKVYEGEIRSVTVPGTMGSFEVLKDHAPIISTLEDGKVIIRKDNSSVETIFIKGGVIEVLNNSIMVLAEGIQDS
ncbi:ATP synthase F1 subunit epsilon [Daejeonella sp.]|jgi:F-type H+-transporting ATPase subunit epsilon|uniref:ATP synthase F1 subunit epsilon n=1 Tax=Daejeonella sp. TaxID=2805397 RepID=UPI0027BA24CC|nr:ATP synthase F1 subunit epsilon [Daejeonella sp.]